MQWNPKAHTDEENARWSWARAHEWINWPLFVSPSLVPLLLLFMSWKWAVPLIIVLSALWAVLVFTGNVDIKINLAKLGPDIVAARWFICGAIVIYLLYELYFIDALVALLWTVLYPPLSKLRLFRMVFMGDDPRFIAPYQQQLMMQLGYELNTPPPAA